MCSCKSLVILLLLLAVSFGQRHNSVPCKPLPGDTLLRRELVERKYKFSRYVSATVHINVDDNIIGCVRALDGWDDDTGGFASFVEGGIGQNYVIVQITSKFNRGFSFFIEVYGQNRKICKYLRMCCVYFRTCPHTHHTCGYTSFYPKLLSG
jgi:hypothetical protein